jgi:septal ring factor EnvC (AmiA/AmiB activator)
MDKYATKEELKVAMREQTDEIVGVIQSFVQQMDDRFNKIEKEINELRDSHNRLLNTIDGFIGRIDKYETELAARDNQFEKLLAWARKVSEKTGVPLENL